MKLYRFEKPEQFRIDTLKKNEIWMALPDSFNDPLDCRLNINDKTEYSTFDVDRIKLAAKYLYEEYDISNGAWLITEEILESIRSWITGDDLTLKPNFLSLIEKRISSFGVQCFSEKDFTSPLMWAHYAQSHQGFCIEYEYKQWSLVSGNRGRFSMSPAIYTSILPEFNLMEILFAPREVAEKLYASKSEDWSYEREHRLVYFPLSPSNGASGESIALPEGLKVTKIIAGLNSKEIISKLNEAAEVLKVPLEKTQLSSSSYDIELEKLCE